MKIRNLICCLMALPALGCLGQTPAAPELWYWHHSYLSNDDAVDSSKALINRAAAAGYTGVVFWDSSFNFMGNPSWPLDNEDRMREVMKHATKKHLKVMATVAPFGWSNDVLRVNKNWAEAQRVFGTLFQVDHSGRQLKLVNSFPGLANPGFELGKSDWFDVNDPGVGINSVAHTGKSSAVIVDAPGNARLRQKITLKPWRQYHLRLFYKSSNFRGSAMLSVLDSTDLSRVRLNPTIDAAGSHDWTRVDYSFDSQDSTEAYLYIGVWGGSSGVLWLDDIQVEETALIHVARRAGTPVTMYDPTDPAKIYREGVDYNYISDPYMAAAETPFHLYHEPPAVTLPRGTHLSPGQMVAIDSYSVFPISYSDEVGMCLTEPGVWEWLRANARAVKNVLPAAGAVLVGYDEMRQMNSCGSCRAKNMTAGQLLAWSAGQSIGLYRSVLPGAGLYFWSDMFDPYHNAVKNYFFVEGDLDGSWKGLSSDVTIMNWNLQRLRESLTWFSGMDSRQPVSHRQIIAGFYDKGVGASAAREELTQAAAIPGVVGLMYTTYADNYSQLESFASGAKAAWGSYRSSLPKP
ncbi:MAG: hypothetical protein JO145_06320 [Acidobacteriaceae bacterium]|nr:hypothetical protein [Acidobacteriaceae bacterium]